MRKISKVTPPPPEFRESVERSKPKSWNDESIRDLKKVWRKIILLREQNNLSGYTEKPFKRDSDSHIDHFRKRAMFPNLTFEWNNLIVDHKDHNYGAGYKDNRIKEEDYNKIFNPVEDEIEGCFFYLQDGEIIPHPKLGTNKRSRANFTIEIFNLNHRSLKNERRDIIKLIRDYKNSDLEEKAIYDYIKKAGFQSVIEQELSKV